MGKRNEKNKKYSAKFKLSVILDMRENKLSYRELCRKYNISEKRPQAWERIYLEEGAEGLTKERRGRASKAGLLILEGRES